MKPRVMQPTRRQAAGGLAALSALVMLPSLSQAADGFDLITESDVRLEAEASPGPGGVRTRQLPVPGTGAAERAPTIEVLTPNSDGGPVSSPLRIEVAFKPAAGAHIVPSTFRLLYGLLKIDVTERLNLHALVSELGVVVDQARVPNGLHRLFMRITDNRGQIGECELLIRVGPRP